MTENNIFCRKRTESSRMFPFWTPGIRVLYMIFCIYPTKNPPVGDGEKGRKAIPLGGFRSRHTRVKMGMYPYRLFSLLPMGTPRYAAVVGRFLRNL